MYRIECDRIFRYSPKDRAYLSVGRVLPGETKPQAIKRIRAIQAEQSLATQKGVRP